MGKEILGFYLYESDAAKAPNSAGCFGASQGENQSNDNPQKGNTLEQVIGELATYLRGWLNCFGYCETSKPLIELERWMRHKLRCLVWKRWKRGTTRYKRVC